MKIPTLWGASSRRKPRRGVALLLVLGGVVLATVLVVSLLFLVKSGRIVSSAYAGQVQTRVLANTALNLAIGQIRDATADTSMHETWASQPGAIRVYNNAGSATTSVDNFVAGYKLFSSSVMTVSGSANESLLTQDVEQDGNPVPTNWASEPGQYVNLNQPVNGVYPIVDPNALPGAGTTPGTGGTANDTTTTVGVEGFADTDASVAKPTGQDYPNLAMPVEWLYQLQDGTLVPGIYQADGTVQVGGSITHAGNAAAYEVPTSSNPIVGRVAFWSDDETSKVNINTASEGMYWDEPRVNTQLKASYAMGPICPSILSQVSDYAAPISLLSTPQGATSPLAFAAIGTDQGYAANQPAANEFNRFPGHPATTSLSAVFSELTPLQIFSLLPRYSLTGVASAATTTVRQSGAVQMYSGLTPVPYTGTLTGGSVMGTLPWIYYACLDPNVNGWDAFCGPSSYNPTVALNANRLYATSGEVMLQPNRAINGALTPAMVQQRKFFLTADSVAPELNLFGCPRVSMWPVNGLYDPQTNLNPTSVSAVDGHTYPYCTAYDKMTAFCATLQPSGQTLGAAEYPFYVKRNNAYSPTDDISTSTTTGASNLKVFNYLHQMTSLAAPGFGGNFQSKFGSDGDQILTEALDYIRCTNIFDSSLEFDLNGNPSQWVGGVGSVGNSELHSVGNQFTSGVRNVVNALHCASFPGYGQVLPLHNPSSPTFDSSGKTNGTASAGLGRTYTVSQVSVHFICTADYKEAGLGAGKGSTNSNTSANLTLNNQLSDGTVANRLLTNNAVAGTWQKRVQAIILIELATPMQGYPALYPSIAATITLPGGTHGGSSFTVSADDPNNPGNNTTMTLFPNLLTSIYTYNDTITNTLKGNFATVGDGSSREGANPIGSMFWNGIGASGYGSFLPFTAIGYSTAVPGFSDTNYRNIKADALARGGGSANVPYPYTPFYTYALISPPFTVNGVTSEQNSTMTVGWPSKPITITLSYVQDGVHNASIPPNNASPFPGVPYQTIQLDFSQFSKTLPVPNLVANQSRQWIFAQNGYDGVAPVSPDPPGQPYPNPQIQLARPGGRLSILGSGNTPQGAVAGSQEFVQCQNQLLDNTSMPNNPGGNTDVVRSLAVVDGDFRLNAAMSSVPATRFAAVEIPGKDYKSDQTTYCLQTLTSPTFEMQAYPWPTNYPFGFTSSYKVDVSNPLEDTAVRLNEGSYAKDSSGNPIQMPAFCNPEYPPTANFTGTKASDTGDWDNGLASMPDGPFANMADEGNDNSTTSAYHVAGIPTLPIFDNPALEVAGLTTCFSPNRMVPSSGMLGSLPTGVQRTLASATPLPWQTLRFRPQSSASASPDYTPNFSTSIPDYLMMDLFWMPVVQPYAISQPFSTAGKINMNYQILPFTYIKRQTGLYAVMKNERMLCVPGTSTAANTYKTDTTAATGFGPGIATGGVVQADDSVAWRHMINVPATLAQFDGVFANNQIFRSPAQICDQYLVPLNGDAPSLNASSGASTVQSTMRTYWSGELLTGNNSRDRPYATIYPRLTTQSNTYRVHYWVQTLKKAAAGSPAYFVDPGSTTALGSGKPADSIRGQLRGSFLIERYMQADDSRLAAWGASNYPTPTANLNSYYKIRIAGSTDFSPQ